MGVLGAEGFNVINGLNVDVEKVDNSHVTKSTQ
jgi:hypothetical protein